MVRRASAGSTLAAPSSWNGAGQRRGEGQGRERGGKSAGVGRVQPEQEGPGFKAGLMDVTDHPDDGSIGVRHLDRLSQRIAIGKEPPHHRLVDDEHQRSALPIAGFEQPALPQRDAERAMIRRRHPALADGIVVGTALPARHRQVGRVHAAAERHAADHVRDAGQLLGIARRIALDGRRAARAHGNQAVVLVERQPAQHHGVHDREDGGAGADAQGEDQQGHGGERRRGAERSDGGNHVGTHEGYDGERCAGVYSLFLRGD